MFNTQEFLSYARKDTHSEINKEGNCSFDHGKIFSAHVFRSLNSKQT